MSSGLRKAIKRSWVGRLIRPPFRWRKRADGLSQLDWIRTAAASEHWADPDGVEQKHQKAYLDLLDEQKGKQDHTHYAHQQVDMDAADVISGVSSPSVGVRFLHAAVLKYRPSTVLEVGSAFGVASMYLASGQKGVTNPRFLGIELDPWRRDIAQSFLDRMGYEWGRIFCGTLEDAIEKGTLPDQIDFCFIDAEHTKKACISYWELLSPRIAPGAVVVFDDIFWSEDMTEFWRWMYGREEVAEACEVSCRYGAVRIR